MIVRPVCAADAGALHALFDATGCPCHCRYFHFDGDKNDWLARCAEPETNRRELDQALARGSDEALGVVAIEGDAVVGWIKLVPSAVAAKAYGQRLYRGLPCFAGDREGIYLIGCALVRPDQRKRGVAALLVGGAVDAARARGARAVEALPRKPREPVSDEELWTVPFSALERHGFLPVGGEDPYPVVRLDLTEAHR